MNQNPLSKSFSLGQIFITRQVLDRLDPADVCAALQRHAEGDWGDCCRKDARANDEALRTGCRLLSVYRDRHGSKFWIITETNRAATTVVLPEDY